ncbi:MAG: sulfotransferase domain-containing protein [Gammaproteobacteria bacterium]|nr:sulfotransferase domain-containing protein [Gammaproteobacteria bacterium]
MEFLNRTLAKFAAESNEHRPFIIVKGHRTGSSFLATQLHSHPDIICLPEIFHPDRVVLGPDHKVCNKDELKKWRCENPLAFIETVLHGKYSHNIKAMGFKLLYEDARGPDRPAWQWMQENTDLHVIHLIRDNHLAQFISLRQAMIRGRWNAKTRVDSSPIRVSLPVEQCEVMFERTESWVKSIQLRFSSHPYLELHYDKLTTDTAKELHSVQEFLGVEPQKLSSDLNKLSTWPLSECIGNYDALKKYFSGSKWERFFDE